MKLFDWLDDRTGCRKLVHTALHEPIPGGARWRYVWGSMLAFCFGLQVVTGLLLMTVYSPSATTAWSSVWYIQTQMPAGWMIRGLHHFGSQAMMILLPLHILQVVFAKAYRAPREVNWWLGLGLLKVTLLLGLTGYLLPWDQKGYWATKVATNIMALTPLVGGALQKLLVGGSDYGHGTLTRFFTLHVMLLPGAFVLLLLAHLALFRRHGVTVNLQRAGKPEGLFWPDQFLRDAIACLAVLAGMIAAVLVVRFYFGSELLDAPADPATADYPARPEWYFLFLFQMLKYFEGPGMEVAGAIGVPAAVGLFLFLVPLLDKVMWRWLAHGIVVVGVLGLIGGAGYLTVQALRADRDPAAQVVNAIHEKQQAGGELTHAELEILRAHQFNEQRAEASRLAKRAAVLASEQGIPPAGPLELLANDPLTRGPALFAANCASCHRYHGHDGRGRIPLEPATSSDLGGFASRPWIRGLVEHPMHHDYFGLMKNEEGEPAHTRMANWLEDLLAEHAEPEARRELLAEFDAVAAYLADESLHPGRLEHLTAEQAAEKREQLETGNQAPPLSTQPSAVSPESPAASRQSPVDNGLSNSVLRPQPSALSTSPADSSRITHHASLSPEPIILRGREVFMTRCNECHLYNGERSGTLRGPEMRGYGSVAWIEDLIADSSQDHLYRSTGRERARMPAFRDQLTPRERQLIARWLHDTREQGE